MVSLTQKLGDARQYAPKTQHGCSERIAGTNPRVPCIAPVYFTFNHDMHSFIIAFLTPNMGRIVTRNNIKNFKTEEFQGNNPNVNPSLSSMS